jgi:histidinol dehydrogenase
VAAIRRATENIRSYHEKQRKLTWMDVQKRTALGQLLIPIDSVGIYVPGGSAPLFSTVMMTALPAVAAGVERIAMVTPPGADGTIAPELLVAAYECEVKEIYKVGGVQAIAALAFGTDSIPAVDKIVGPGNIYVTQAKKEVFGTVGIDMTAGPSEILIVADFSARPEWVAADMISQAEHDAMSAASVVTDDESVAVKITQALEKQLGELPRESTARKSLETCGAVLVVSDMLTAMEYSNKIAPEHLELCVDNPFGLLGFVRNAGSCFLGHFSPEPLGDYYAGPNHVLPTSGTARFFSTLSVDDFVKKTTVIRYSKTALVSCAQDVMTLARAEGLEGHARAVQYRVEDGAENR